MEIIIVRHASAEDRGANGDEDRKLTPEGKQEAHSTGVALKAMGVAPAKIMTSPLIRARETADILAGLLGGEVEVMELLGPPGDPKEALSDIEEMESKGMSCVVLVGHNPSLEEFIGYFISGDTEAKINLTKAGAAGLSYQPHGQAQPTLEWLMRRKQLKMVADRFTRIRP